MLRLKVLFILPFLLFIISRLTRQYFQPIAIVAPHHNVVKETRLKFFKHIASLRPQTNTIVIVGPDHFSPSQQSILSIDTKWQLATGIINYDQKIGKLITSSTIQNQAYVKSDHAVYNLLPDILSVWPKASIVPILIGEKVTKELVNKLVFQIYQNCKSSCLLLVSVDFSHYLPNEIAKIHDIFTQNSLADINSTSILQSEVDSPISLFLMTEYAKLHQSSGWSLFTRTYSQATSHLFGYYYPTLFPPFQKPFSTTYTAYHPDIKQTIEPRFLYGTQNIYPDYSLPQNQLRIGVSDATTSFYYQYSYPDVTNAKIIYEPSYRPQ